MEQCCAQELYKKSEAVVECFQTFTGKKKNVNSIAFNH